MLVKHMIGASTLAAGVGVAGLLELGNGAGRVL
jgi:hypothetical protein